MIGQTNLLTWTSALLDESCKRAAGVTLILRSTLAGMFLLTATACSSLELTPYVDLFLVLALMSALAVVDLAMKAFPASKPLLTPGLLISSIAVFMLFHH